MTRLTTKHVAWFLTVGSLAFGCTSGQIQSNHRVPEAQAAQLTFTPLVAINFQPASTATPSGSLADTGATYGNRGNGWSYGWGADNGAQARERGAASSPDKRHDTLIHMQKPAYPNAVWELALPDGTYQVHVVAGDPSYADSVFRIDAEGARVVDGTPTGANPWVEGTAVVTVSDGRLTLTNGSGASNNKIDYVEIATANDAGGGGGNGGAGGAGAMGGNAGSAGGSSGTGTTGGTGIGPTGSVARACAAGVPAGGQLVDTSRPTTVVGNGTAASCTNAALASAVAAGGIVTFACGASAVTIPITATLRPPVDRDTVIDGGGKVTLDGGHAVQIVNFTNPNFRFNEARLTVQRIAFANARQSGSQAIPAAPAPCSQGFDDGQGGAIFIRDGNLTVIDSLFTNNAAADVGPDTGGGAIYVLGSKHGALVVHSTFTGNTGANGGAIYALQSELRVVNSRFDSNRATGNGANGDDASKCSVVHAGQHQVGSGGNGGAIAADGVSFNVTLCGDEITNNAAGAGAFGGGLFVTINDWNGVLTIADTTMTGNTGGSWTSVARGSVNRLGTAVGTNAGSITLTSSTLQGL